MQSLGRLRLAWKINDAWWLDGFFGMVIEGKQRIGKSSYANQAFAEAFGKWELLEGKPVCVKPNYEEVKKWTVFLPVEFVDKILAVYNKQKGLDWDDAGFWLFVLDWYEPFVKIVAKYIQLSGRQFGAILLSTPSKKLISSKVLEAIPEIYVCRVSRDFEAARRDTARFRPRRAKVYERWDYPDGKKGGVRTRWTDHFNAIMDDKFYFDWYKPKSDSYTQAAKDLLKKQLRVIENRTERKDKKELMKDEEFMEDVHKVTGSPDKLREVDEAIEQLI